MTFYETRDFIRDFLADEGYRPELDKDGDILFKREGWSFFVLLDDNDKEFFRVLLPNIDHMEEGTSEDTVIRAALETARKIKVAKVFINKGTAIHVSAELLCENVEAFTKVLSRTLDCCLAARLGYNEEKNRIVAEDSPKDES